MNTCKYSLLFSHSKLDNTNIEKKPNFANNKWILIKHEKTDLKHKNSSLIRKNKNNPTNNSTKFSLPSTIIQQNTNQKSKKYKINNSPNQLKERVS